jgi:putative transposase
MAYRRKNSLRLKGKDYSDPGYYFITLCTQNRTHYFGTIISKKLHLSPYGEIAHTAWENIQNIYPQIILDEFQIMPNHIHGIIKIKKEKNPPVRVAHCATPTLSKATPTLSKATPALSKATPALSNPSISLIIKSYKEFITKTIRKEFGDFSFGWQRSFHDSIIEGEIHLKNIRRYIQNNPANWKFDKIR